MNRTQLIHVLESLSPGLSPRELIEQGNCYIFRRTSVETYNEEIRCLRDFNSGIECAVRAKEMLDLLKRLKGEEIEITAKDGKLYVKPDKQRQGWLFAEKDILIDTSMIKTPSRWSKLSTDFGKAVSLANESTGTSIENYGTNLVHFTKTHIEGSDNYRLSRYNIDLKCKSSFMIHRDSAKHLTSGFVGMAHDDTWSHFKNDDGLILSCRRIADEGKYPNLDFILDVKGEAIMLPTNISEEARTAEIFNRESMTSESVVKIELKKNKIRLSTQGIYGGYKSEEKVSYNGPELTFSVGPDLLETITRQETEATINESFIKIVKDNFQFVASLEDK